MAKSAAAITKGLEALGDPRVAAGAQRYFKTGPGEYGAGDLFLGIRAAQLYAFAKTHYDASLTVVLRLLRSRYHEGRALALILLARAHERGDASTRERIVAAYLAHTDVINNWDLVDYSAPRILGAHLGPGRHQLLTQLAHSTSLWERRIAILATLSFIRQDYYAETLRVAKILLRDPEDLIHKGVGWMLREVGNRDRAVEERFLDQYAAVMPRTMLRYAIEKFPPKLRQQYMRQRA